MAPRSTRSRFGRSRRTRLPRLATIPSGSAVVEMDAKAASEPVIVIDLTDDSELMTGDQVKTARP